MSNKIFVRIPLRQEATRFFRCGMEFTKQWREVEVDAATEKRLKEEQMLEVSVDVPADLENDSPNSASQAEGSSDGNGGSTSGTPTVVAPTDPAERLEAIKAAAATLDKADASLWMKNGQPKTEAIAVVTGWPVTAAERNEAVPVAAE